MKVKLPEKIYILIVDDNPIDREVYRRILERKWEKRCEFDEADTGKKALEKVKHNTYQAILLDYGLPDMSGISFLESLPANVLSNTAILMITGHENLEMAISAFKTGVQDYLPKFMHCEMPWKKCFYKDCYRNKKQPWKRATKH